ncbi:GNAT family N-acetyltransferase [Abyssisolibacter fermentans]|uniref:GNAT family N-acetyltransferase n=1 Tax=Abyssisolibacter fermentans TaxID=1766203 RepID=UPI00083408AD|nr:GNAT family protein [Abyssisolibacter fermentans]
MKDIRLKNGEVLHIRKAEVSDAEAMLKYLNTIAGESDFLTFGVGEFNMPVEREKEIIQSCRDSDNRIFIIGEIDGRIVANLNFAAGGRPRTKHVGEFGISVLKEYWGMSIGKNILSCLIDWAKNNGIRKINLRTREDNHRAIKLYQDLGFEQEGILKRDFLTNGEFYSSVCMGLIID